MPKLKYRNGSKIETLLGLSGELLWRGVYYMHGGQSVTFPKSVYDFQFGLVLVWSYYNGSSAEDYWFQCDFVPREDIREHCGAGHVFILSSGNFSHMATKYLYIRDNGITGHNDNSKTGTAGSGIAYKNNSFVLREVWGV